MMSFNNRMLTADRIKKIGYIMICVVMREIIVSGKRIAFYGELKSIKMLVNPVNIDLEEDCNLLRILDEPHVKLASELADYVCFEVLNSYGNLNALDDDKVMAVEIKDEMGARFSWRFMFYRSHHLRRDRYINFNKVLLFSRRLIYEFLKLMIYGQTSAFEAGYRVHYSTGRLKALVAGHEGAEVLMLVGLIDKLMAYEIKSNAIAVKT